MSSTTSILFGRYNIFGKMDQAADLRPAAHLATQGRHLNYYVAIACVLLVGYLFRSSKQKRLDLPFYKAAKTKWIFDAETLIRDSYNKVCRPWSGAYPWVVRD